MTTEILPGILTHSMEDYLARIEQVEKAGLTWAHIDVMDGQFVPNITVMPHEFMGVQTPLKLEAHMMVFHPERYYSDLSVARVQRVLIHREAYESLEQLQEAIHLAADYFPEVGVVYNPATFFDLPADAGVQSLLIMGVQPGSSGQPFIPEVYTTLQSLAGKLPPELVLEIDGGVHEENVAVLKKWGVSRFVISSRLFTGYTITEQLSTFQTLINT